MFRPSAILIIALLLLLPCHHGARLRTAPKTTPPTTKGRAVTIRTPPPRAPNRHSRDHFAAFWTPPPDVGSPNGALCQIWIQDCPEGYKCIPEDLNSQPRCRKIDNDAKTVGDYCETLGNNDGDTCDIDGMCIEGTCLELCSGTPAAPECPGDGACHVYSAGGIVCEEKCDPLGSSCPNAQYCSIDAPSQNAEFEFTCMFKPDYPLKVEGDSCEYTSNCAQGLACVDKEQMKTGFCNSNSALSCCTRLADDESGCQNGDVLIPYYSSPQPGLEHVGVCVTFPY